MNIAKNMTSNSTYQMYLEYSIKRNKTN